jgi:adenylate kinase family enzyme
LSISRIAKRDAAKKRFEQKSGKDDKAAVVRERANVYKEKESATMAMFQKLAKERFG